MHNTIKITNNDDWLIERNKGIGGSDAGAILGLNPFKSNVDLWEEKTGKKAASDVSDKDAVIYGKKAEEPLRMLFMLDNPQYTLEYHPFDILQSIENPYIQGTLDGVLIDSEGNKGILEIKTCEIKNNIQWRNWDNKIPDYYYAQILHYMALDPEFKFVILTAQIKNNGNKVTRAYEFKRCDCIDDINYLIQEEATFWGHVQSGSKPPLKLPEV